MEIQKIFSDMYDEERLYSVLLTEDEMNLYQAMFSDEEAKGAAIGAGSVVGAGAGAAGLGYAAKKGGEALNKKLQASRKVLRGDYLIEGEKARREFQIKHALAKGNPAYNAEVQKVEKQLDKIYKKINKLGTEGNIEKGARKASELASKAGKAIKNHKLAAGLTAAGLTAAGAGVGALAKYRKNNKD